MKHIRERIKEHTKENTAKILRFVDAGNGNRILIRRGFVLGLLLGFQVGFEPGFRSEFNRILQVDVSFVSMRIQISLCLFAGVF